MTADAEVLLVVLDDPEVPEVPEVVVVTRAEVVFSLKLEKDDPEPYLVGIGVPFPVVISPRDKEEPLFP